MPEHRDMKRLVRERMAKTGENYTTALAALGGHGSADRPPARRTAMTPIDQSGGGLLVDDDGRTYEVGDLPLRIGRSDRGASPAVAIRLHDPYVSRFHAVVTTDDGGVFVHDLDSTNGTYVDGVRVTSQRITGGEAIKVGGTTLTYRRTAR